MNCPKCGGPTDEGAFFPNEGGVRLQAYQCKPCRIVWTVESPGRRRKPMAGKRITDLVPKSWLDPLLSGKGVPPLPWGCPEIARLLNGVRKRIAEAELRRERGVR